MTTHVHIRLFATLNKFTPENANHYPVTPGITIHQLLRDLNVPTKEVKLIFVDGRKASIDTVIQGGERIGIFPPIGGG